MENEKTEVVKRKHSKLTVAVVAGFILHALVICVLCYGWANQSAINRELQQEMHNIKQVMWFLGNKLRHGPLFPVGK